MKVVIEIECDNAAFEDDFGAELSHILSTVPLRVLHQRHRPGSACDATEWSDKLLDSNGNTVGKVEVTD